MTPAQIWSKISKQKKACISLLGASIGALLVTNNKLGLDSASLFNPEGSGALRRALASHRVRSLVAKMSDYDTEQERPIPDFYNNFANIWESLTDDDQPFLWYVPKAGSNTFTKVICHCLEMVVCSRLAAAIPGGLEPTTELTIKEDKSIGKYVNIDPSTATGIAQAVEWGLASSNMADVIVTQRLRDAAPMFSPSHRARAFLFLRHPIKRAVELFYYRQRATWEPIYDKELAIMSIEEYASSDKLIENYLVRSLINKVSPDVTAEDVAMAKDILRRKFLIGISEPKWYDLSIVKFEKYFGWWDEYAVLTNHTINYCHHEKISSGDHFGSSPKLEPGSSPYNKVAVRNWADIELYSYAKILFHEQTVLV